jgi:predicted aspartyl protease
MQATKKMTELKVDTGVRSMYTSVPARVAENTNAEQLSVRHMAAVLNGRGEGENINVVADALHRAGYLERLLDKADR